MSPAIIEIPLQSDDVRTRCVPFTPETELTGVPAIVTVLAGGEHCTVAVKLFAVDPILKIRSGGTPLANTAEATHLSASTSRHQPALSILRFLCDEVNNAVHGVRARHSRSRPTNCVGPG